MTHHAPPLPREHAYEVNNGLRSSELLLLQRAIKMYIKDYTAIKAASKQPWEKAEADSYISAAVAVSQRLRHDIKEIKDGE